MPASGGPQDGDLVVTRESHSAVRYTIREVPGDPQVSMAARDEALRLAQQFASRRGVDVWYAEDGGYQPVQSFRPRGARA